MVGDLATALLEAFLIGYAGGVVLGLLAVIVGGR